MIFECFCDSLTMNSSNAASFFIRSGASEAEKVAQRQELLTKLTGVTLEAAASAPPALEHVGSHNCENIVGSVSLPVGVAGPFPLTIVYDNNTELHPTVIVPLATTEGALVASTNRGARALAASGGCVATVTKVGMSRAPAFECTDAAAAAKFSAWIKNNEALFEQAARETSSHAAYTSLRIFLRENYVFVRVVFDTDEAMGMNMVSSALSFWWEQLVPAEVKKNVILRALSGNVCGDKKPAALTREMGRGYSVKVTATLSDQVLREVLHVSAANLVATHRAKNVVGSEVAGIPAGNMHVANMVVASYIALGQDPAHVVDTASSAEVSFSEVSGGVTVLLTLPSIPVGTVGGGTRLPQQHEFQSILFGTQPKAFQVAAAVAAAALCGEISGLAALSTNTLAAAHNALGRAQ